MLKPAGRYDTVYISLKALKNAHRATFWHSIGASRVAVKIAAKAALEMRHTAQGEPAPTLNDVRHAAFLHDIGKLYVPMQILKKDGFLTAREREDVLPHPLWGEQILLSSNDHRVRRLARFVREHHELPDGSGYPGKLTLDEIAPVSKVINIADRFAALTENRPYRDAVLPEFVIEMLRADITAFFGHEAHKVIDVLARFRSGATFKLGSHGGTTPAPVLGEAFALAG